VANLVAGPARPRHHGPDRDVENASGVVIAELIDVDEQQQGPIARVQRGQRPLQRRAQLLIHVLLLRAGRDRGAEGGPAPSRSPFSAIRSGR